MCRPQIMTNFLTSVLVISILLFNYKSQASLGRRIPTGSSGMNTNVAIYPGTKWCGLGDNAHHSEDLGRFFATDKCCRDHDKCPNVIKPGECKYGLCNNTPFTSSHCECDEQFRECLTNARDPASLPVGKIFFDVAGMSCFRLAPNCQSASTRQDEEFLCSMRANRANVGQWRFERPRPFLKPALLNSRTGTSFGKVWSKFQK